MKTTLVLVVLSLFLVAQATVLFKEEFDDDLWQSRWVISQHKVKEGTAGKFSTTAGKFHGDENDKGLKTTQDARFYQISSKFPAFSNDKKTLVLQYTVKHEQKIDCGGGYIKLMPDGFDQENFNGDSKYYIMFGPDICGFSTKRVHVIFNYKGKNHLISKEIKCKDDEYTHIYTLIVKPDQTYQVLIDGESVQTGDLPSDWDFLPPKEIKDPKASKPADWVDAAEIPDPEAVKPEGWDEIPAQIVDPDAEKPEDWDEEADGEWEAPMIENPDYKGEWSPPKIKNPDYKGPWIHPMVPNPDYHTDDSIYSFKDIGGAAFEIWQVKAGTIFDHILITDNVDEAAAAREPILKAMKIEKEQGEKAKEEEKKEAERKAEETKDGEEDIEEEDIEDAKDEL